MIHFGEDVEFIDVSDLYIPLTREHIEEEVRNDPRILELAKELGYAVEVPS